MKEITNFRKYLVENKLNEQPGKLFFAILPDGMDDSSIDNAYPVIDVTGKNIGEIESVVRKYVFDNLKYDEDEEYPGDEEFDKKYPGGVSWEDGEFGYDDSDGEYPEYFNAKIFLFKT